LRIFGFVVLAFVVGLVGGYVLVAAGAFAWMAANDVFDSDGGMSMGILFAMAPAGGILAGLVAALVTLFRMRARARHVAAGTRPPVRRWPLGLRAVVAGIVWGLAVYLVIEGLYWLAAPMTFASYEAAMAVAWLPVAAAVLAVILAVVFVVRRNAPRLVAPQAAANATAPADSSASS
jgi:hypothetical protein